jgi:hypothetical protein
VSSAASGWQASRAHWAEWLQRARSLSATLWRGVEAQHKVATLKVVDTLAEQQRLEELLEESKPPLPREATALHYLLATPFRYASPWPSRFRAAHEPGVWYGARALRSACAETGYWRWRFAADSDALRDEQVVSELTFFQAQVRGRVADLAAPPWNEFEAAWMHSSDYTATHALARAARDVELHWIHYRSVRDPQHGACGAVLRAPALRMGDLTRQHTWVCRVRRESVVMQATALDSAERPFEFAFR